jgi:hypothetical protein
VTERIRALDTIVPGVFPSREAAEAAITDLRELGFADDTLGVIVPDLVHHRLLDDSTHEVMTGLERRILLRGGCSGARPVRAKSPPGGAASDVILWNQ